MQSIDIGLAESLAFAPHDTRLAVAGRDGFLRVCQPNGRGSWSTSNTIRAHTEEVREAAWSPDGTRLATAGSDHVVKLWDTSSWHELAKITSFSESVYAISFSPDGRRLAVAARNQPLKVWDIEQSQFVAELLGHTALVTSVDHCPDGWRLVSASEDGTVRLWDAVKSTNHDRLEGHRWKVRAVAFSPLGDILASGGDGEPLIILWNALTCEPLQVIPSIGIGVNDLAFSPDGNYLASAHGFGESFGRLFIWDVAGNRAKVDLPLNPHQLVGVAWAPDGTRLAIQLNDGTIRLIEASSGRELTRRSEPKGPMGSIAFSNDGKLIVSAGGDADVRVRRSNTLSLVHNLKGHNAPVVNAVFNPQGSLIASSSNDHTIRLWDAATGKYIRTFAGHEGTPLELAFNSDGTRLASCSTDQTVKIWNVASGLELQSIVGHTNWVRDIAFSPDGEQLSSVGYDGFVRMWHAPTQSTYWATTREAAALVKYLAASCGARELTVRAINEDTTISDAVRAAAIRQAEEWLFYWSPMLAGHRAAERQDWVAAIDAFQRVTDLAPDDAMHWHWLAMASLAGAQNQIYQHACDELLNRFGAGASDNELSLILKTWVVSNHDVRELASLAPVVDAYARRVTELSSLPWLYKLRRGTIPIEFLGPAASPTEADPGPAYWVIQAIAWHKVGDTAKALAAYQAAIRAGLLFKHPLWESDYYQESLRREVEDLLGIESPSETNHLSRPTATHDSPAAVPPALEPLESLPSAANN